MNNQELKACLSADRRRMLGNTKKYHILYIAATQNPAWLRWKFVKNMRKEAYYQDEFLSGHKLSVFPMLWFSRISHRYGNKLGFELGGGYWLHR